MNIAEDSRLQDHIASKRGPFAFHWSCSNHVERMDIAADMRLGWAGKQPSPVALVPTIKGRKFEQGTFRAWMARNNIPHEKYGRLGSGSADLLEEEVQAFCKEFA